MLARIARNCFNRYLFSTETVVSDILQPSRTVVDAPKP